jgi:hypothetical protein
VKEKDMNGLFESRERAEGEADFGYALGHISQNA